MLIGDDRRSRIRNHVIKNHRDDSLHEPETDKDNEKEDDEKERIVEDKKGLQNKNYRDDALHEPENDKDDKIIDEVNESEEEATKNDEKLDTGKQNITKFIYFLYSF